MCACSEFKISGVEIKIFIGYYPGHIEVNGIKYKKETMDDEVSEFAKNRNAVKKELSKLSKKDLVEAFVLVAENGGEG